MAAVKHYFVKASTKFTNTDAQVIGPVLGELAEQGPVTARDVVEAAHSSNSPLHSYFEWDDKKAADLHRIGTAREMIKTVRVRVVTSIGSERGLAAQKVVVRSSPPTRNAYSSNPVAHYKSTERKENDALTRHSLDTNYYPANLEEACDIIDVLREMVAAFTGDESIDGQDIGMTKKEATIYRFLKNKSGLATKQNIMTVLYGAGGDQPEPKIVDVFICKLRKKLPIGETIETDWGNGYRWSRVETTNENIPKRRFTDHAEMDPENVRGLPDNNQAIIEGRTLFPSTVVSPQDSPALLVSGENSRKLGSHVTKGPWAGFPIYQLSLEERATCPRSCFNWRTCYGNGMQLARRHKADDMLIPYLKAELTDLQDEFPRGFAVRLHVLGDFFSEEYARQWLDWLNEFPALHVFGYTAHPKESAIGRILLLGSEQWDRFAMRFSASEPQTQGATTIWRMPEDDAVWEGIVCPAQTGKTDCCGTCGLCWAVSAKDKTIVFIAHGPKKAEPIKGPTREQLMAGRAR